MGGAGAAPSTTLRAGPTGVWSWVMGASFRQAQDRPCGGWVNRTLMAIKKTRTPLRVVRFADSDSGGETLSFGEAAGFIPQR